jgi:hypothetical protein
MSITKKRVSEFETVIHVFELIGGKHFGNTICYMNVDKKDFTANFPVSENQTYRMKQTLRNKITLLTPVSEYDWSFVSMSDRNERWKRLADTIASLNKELNMIENPA